MTKRLVHLFLCPNCNVPVLPARYDDKTRTQWWICTDCGFEHDNPKKVYYEDGKQVDF